MPRKVAEDSPISSNDASQTKSGAYHRLPSRCLRPRLRPAKLNKVSSIESQDKDVAVGITLPPAGKLVFEDAHHDRYRGTVEIPTKQTQDSGRQSAPPVLFVYKTEKGDANIICNERDNAVDFTLFDGDTVDFNVATDRRDGHVRPINVTLVQDLSFKHSKEQRENGFVTTLKEGFGFIRCTDREARMFFHFKEKLDAKSEMKEQQEVQFTVVEDPSNCNRLIAVRIKALPTGSIPSAENCSQDKHTGTVEKVADVQLHTDTDPGIIMYDVSGTKQTLPYSSFAVDGELPRLNDKVEFQISECVENGTKTAVNMRVCAHPSLPRERGHIVTLKDSFGFIESSDHQNKIFFDFGCVEGSADDLDLGDEVEFTVSHKARICAENIRRLSSSTSSTSSMSAFNKNHSSIEEGMMSKGLSNEQQEEMRKRQDDMTNSILSQVLDQPARARLNMIALTKPEKAKMVESMLLQMAQTGQIQSKLGEEELKSLLERVSEKTQKTTTVKKNKKLLRRDRGCSNLGCHHELSNIPSLDCYVSLDCEYVQVDGSYNALGRCSIVDAACKVLMDDYCRPRDKTMSIGLWKGIHAKDDSKALPFSYVQSRARYLIKNRILVGHDLKGDLKALEIEHPASLVRDTSLYIPLRRISELDEKKQPSLSDISRKILGRRIQKYEHCSVEDCQATMEVFLSVRRRWEHELIHKRGHEAMIASPNSVRESVSWTYGSSAEYTGKEIDCSLHVPVTSVKHRLRDRTPPHRNTGLQRHVMNTAQPVSSSGYGRQVLRSQAAAAQNTVTSRPCQVPSKVLMYGGATYDAELDDLESNLGYNSDDERQTGRSGNDTDNEIFNAAETAGCSSAWKTAIRLAEAAELNATATVLAFKAAAAAAEAASVSSYGKSGMMSRKFPGGCSMVNKKMKISGKKNLRHRQHIDMGGEDAPAAKRSKGLTVCEDEDAILARVMAESQQEYYMRSSEQSDQNNEGQSDEEPKSKDNNKGKSRMPRGGGAEPKF